MGVVETDEHFQASPSSPNVASSPQAHQRVVKLLLG
jgi:hypothetical protein